MRAFDSETALSRAIARDPERPARILRELVRIPSVNPWFGGASELAGELAVQEWLAARLRALGAQVTLQEPDLAALRAYSDWPGYYAERDFSGRPNLWARLKGTGGGRSLLLFGHADVVAPGDGWTHDPFGGAIEEGHLYGRGAVDMKGGLAAMLAALEYIREAGIRPLGDVIFATAIDEEAGGMGTLALVASGLRTDAAILGEPTALRIAPLCRGILWGQITVRGRSGHIELPQPPWREGGAVDAISKARLILGWLDELNLDWARRKVHPLLPEPCSVRVAQIRAGHSPTSFADCAEIIFDAQYLPAERDARGLGSRVKDEIAKWLTDHSSQDDWLAEHPPELAWLVDADCAEVQADHPFVQSLSAAVEAARPGKQAVLEGAGCHTDMGLLARVGIPTVNFGPGDPRKAHQADENLSVRELLTATGIYARTILNWCGSQPRKQGECDG